MNQYPGVIGQKLGMTQIFGDDGSVVACTVVEARPVVVGKRTQEKDGYDAILLGVGERKEKHASKPLAGFYKKAGVTPKRMLRELRCSAEYAAGFEVGQEVALEQLFEEGQFVDVQGVSRGRGFTGVMRRHNFAGNVNSHGTHEYRRHGGSIGTNMTPGRTHAGSRHARPARQPRHQRAHPARRKDHPRGQLDPDSRGHPRRPQWLGRRSRRGQAPWR